MRIVVRDKGSLRVEVAEGESLEIVDGALELPNGLGAIATAELF